MASYVSPDDALAAARSQSHITTRSWLTGADERDVVGILPIDGPRSATVLPAEASPPLKGTVVSFTGCRYGIAGAALLLVAIACLVISLTIGRNAVIGDSARPVDGLTIFAVFFVAALGIERLLEPLSNALLPKADAQRGADEATKEAGQAIELNKTHADATLLPMLADKSALGELDDAQVKAELTDLVQKGHVSPRAAQVVFMDMNQSEGDNKTDTADKPNPTATALEKAATTLHENAETKLKAASAAAEALSVRQLARTTVFWTIATCLGMLAAAAMDLYFLNTVGITKAKAWMEILATGLIIGGGTKPLHDLVTLISAKSGDDA